MNTETAFAHLEAFIAGGDELGEVPESAALEALEVIRKEYAYLHRFHDKITTKELGNRLRSSADAAYGWVCPVCGNVNAPWLATCGGSHVRATTASLTNTKGGG